MNIEASELIALKKDILKQSHILRFRVKGKSMHPFIKDGSIIRAKSIDAYRINRADIILYQNSQNELVVHRVIKKQTNNGKFYFLARGDSSWQADEPVYPEKILGKVVIIEKSAESALNIEKGTFRILNLFYAKILFLKRWLARLRSANLKFKQKSLSRPEDLLINCLCLCEINAMEAQSFFNQELDWEYFLDKVFSAGLAALVYNNLNKIVSHRQIIPKSIERKLESAYYTIAARNTLLSIKLKEILFDFKEDKIEVILLKGMALIHGVYDNIFLRPMYDIDILIHKDDLTRAKNRLEKLGYICKAGYPENFYKEGVRLDLHLEFLNTYRVKTRNKFHRIDLEKIWRNSQAIKIDEAEARILSPEDTLSQLCLHLAFHHGFSGLMWYFDIIKFLQINREIIDWNKFIFGVRENKTNKPIYYVLYCINQISAGTISQDILQDLKPKNIGLLESRIAQMIFSKQYSKDFRFLFTLVMLDSLGSRILFLKNIFFPSVATLKARYESISVHSLLGYYFLHFQQVFLSGLDILRKILFIS